MCEGGIILCSLRKRPFLHQHCVTALGGFELVYYLSFLYFIIRITVPVLLQLSSSA